METGGRAAYFLIGVDEFNVSTETGNKSYARTHPRPPPPIRFERGPTNHDREGYKHSLRIRNVFTFNGWSLFILALEGNPILRFRLGGVSLAEDAKEVAGGGEPTIVQDDWNRPGPSSSVLCSKMQGKKIPGTLNTVVCSAMMFPDRVNYIIYKLRKLRTIVSIIGHPSRTLIINDGLPKSML